MGKSLSPLKTGFPLRYNKHRASSNQHLYASPARTGPGRASEKFDKRTQTRRFEALASLSTSIAKFRRGEMNEVNEV